MKPDFLVVGASRSGTTTLHGLMLQHENISCLNRKDSTISHLKTRIVAKKYPMPRTDYERCFAGTEQFAIRGEISPSYLWVPETVELIFSEHSSKKIIILLRHPVEQPISDFQYSWQYGINKTDFSEFARIGVQELAKGRLAITPSTLQR